MTGALRGGVGILRLILRRGFEATFKKFGRFFSGDSNSLFRIKGSSDQAASPEHRAEGGIDFGAGFFGASPKRVEGLLVSQTFEIVNRASTGFDRTAMLERRCAGGAVHLELGAEGASGLPVFIFGQVRPDNMLCFLMDGPAIALGRFLERLVCARLQVHKPDLYRS